jgi:hypothetical protein
MDLTITIRAGLVVGPALLAGMIADHINGRVSLYLFPVLIMLAAAVPADHALALLRAKASGDATGRRAVEIIPSEGRPSFTKTWISA